MVLPAFPRAGHDPTHPSRSDLVIRSNQAREDTLSVALWSIAGAVFAIAVVSGLAILWRRSTLSITPIFLLAFLAILVGGLAFTEWSGSYVAYFTTAVVGGLALIAAIGWEAIRRHGWESRRRGQNDGSGE